MPVRPREKMKSVKVNDNGVVNSGLNSPIKNDKTSSGEIRVFLDIF
jgi:hypothetical protein